MSKIWFRNNRLLFRDNRILFCDECPCGVTVPEYYCEPCDAFVPGTGTLNITAAGDAECSPCSNLVGSYVLTNSAEEPCKWTGIFDIDELDCGAESYDQILIEATMGDAIGGYTAGAIVWAGAPDFGVSLMLLNYFDPPKASCAGFTYDLLNLGALCGFPGAADWTLN